MNKSKIKVLIVDDSAYLRAILKDIINSDDRFEVVAMAQDPYEARDLIKQTSPDVLTLDIEMPKMNGITFLKNLMRLRPMPVIMISTLTQAGAPATLEALEYGAVDFVSKPSSGDDAELLEYKGKILDKIYWASKANIQNKDDDEDKSSSRIATGKKVRSNFICAIGASTGGTEAIKAVVGALPEDSPPIIISQHIPETFSSSFARRLDGLSAMNVHEAEHGQEIKKGNVYIAPGHSHLKVVGVPGSLKCVLDQGPPVNRHRPAVEVMFDSVRQVVNKNVLGVLLTGMGSDGAEALLRMKEAGCGTIIQDEASSVVWGMPGAAHKLGAYDKVLSLDKIADAIMKAACSTKNRKD